MGIPKSNNTMSTNPTQVTESPPTQAKPKSKSFLGRQARILANTILFIFKVLTQTTKKTKLAKRTVKVSVQNTNTPSTRSKAFESVKNESSVPLETKQKLAQIQKEEAVFGMHPPKELRIVAYLGLSVKEVIDLTGTVDTAETKNSRHNKNNRQTDPKSPKSENQA